MNPSSQPENREQQIEEIVRDYDTWCLCDCDECPNSYNYKRAIEAIDRLVTEARIETTRRCARQTALMDSKTATSWYIEELNALLKENHE